MLSIYYTCQCCAGFDIGEQLRSVIDHSVSGQTGKKRYCVDNSEYPRQNWKSIRIKYSEKESKSQSKNAGTFQLHFYKTDIEDHGKSYY